MNKTAELFNTGNDLQSGSCLAIEISFCGEHGDTVFDFLPLINISHYNSTTKKKTRYLITLNGALTVERSLIDIPWLFSFQLLIFFLFT